MRVLDQSIMNQVFDVLDDLGLDREAVQVPLLMAGEGAVQRLGSGRFEIELPDTDDLGPFLTTLPEQLRRAGWTGGARV